MPKPKVVPPAVRIFHRHQADGFVQQVAVTRAATKVGGQRTRGNAPLVHLSYRHLSFYAVRYNMYVLSTIRKYFIALTKFSSIRNRRDWHAPRKNIYFLAGQRIITWGSQLGSWLDDRPAKGRATGLIEKGKGSKSSLGRTLAQTSRGPNGGRLFSGWLVRY